MPKALHFSVAPYAALPQLFPPSLRSSPPAISTSWTHSFSEQSHWWKLFWKHQCQKLCILVSLSPYAALLQLFPRLGPTVFQDNRNDNICPEKTSQQLWQSRNNSSALSSPQAISTAWMLSRSLPAKLSPSYFHGFLSVQHALRKLFAWFPVRPALSRSLPAKLSASYLHGFLSVQHAVSLPPSEALPKLFARFPVRPACCLAPSQRSSPQAISTVSSRPACCLAPSRRTSPQAISTVSSPSSMLSRSLPAKLSTSYLHGFLSVQHAVSLPPSEAHPKLIARFPVPCQRSSPQAISTVSCPSSMLSRSLPAKLSASYFHCFLSVQHAVSLPPSEAFRKLFARFPIRRACCLAPSQRSSPQAICTVSYPSSMLSRSLPAKLSPSYLHGFLSVQHAVSLPPSEAFRKLFPRFPVRPACCLAPSLQRNSPQAICTVSSPSSTVSLPPSEAFCKLFAWFPVRPACCLAPSQRSSPQAICTVSCPSSMLSRSLLAKLSPSYFHGFLSVQHAVSLPPSEDLPKLFPRFPLRPACCLAPSQRSFPQAISTVSCPSSMLSRSLPAAKLSASYLHGFQSVQHCLAPSQRSFLQAICMVSCPSSMLSRSLPAKLSPSYLHGFLSVQHAVSLPLSEALPKLFPRFPLRPACAPSQRSSP